MVRLFAALMLPAAVPAILTALIWALPGDPAEIICPRASCEATDALAARWHLDEGAWGFYSHWARGALAGEFGMSWRVLQGVPVNEMLGGAVPTTLLLLAAALVPVIAGAVGAGTGFLPRRADAPLQVAGLVPAVIFALFFAAVVALRFGGDSYGDEATRWRVLLGAVVLAVADGALAGAVGGVRALFRSERKQRYVQIAALRGEGILENVLPNVAAALAGQLRARVLHLVSGLVVVEVVLKIDGLGDLLWAGTLKQDFGVVLAAATGFAAVSAGLLLAQAILEIAVALHIRRAPRVSAVTA
jgi:ABC-type dipeptide/oligopeptide/nickel transport system permease component